MVLESKVDRLCRRRRDGNERLQFIHWILDSQVAQQEFEEEE